MQTIVKEHLENMHYPRHTRSALSEIEGIRPPLAEFHTVVLERRYDNTAEPGQNERPGFAVVLLGDEVNYDMRQATLGWGDGEWAMEVLYQLAKMVESEMAPTVTERNAYSQWPEALRRYVHSCVIPMEWKDQPATWLDERLFAYPLRGGELQEPKVSEDYWM